MGEALPRSEDVTPRARDDDLLECDIVMAGGVTSGVVYPGAVAEIAKRYRFRAIGGASVGALAAAVAAAAELGRASGANPRSFDEIGALAAELGARESNGRSRLFNLFPPEPETRALFALAASLIAAKDVRGRLACLFRASIASAATLAPPAATLATGFVSAMSLWSAGAWPLALFVCLAALGLAVSLWAVALLALIYWRWLPALRDNDFGLCRGHAEESEALTDWLHRIVQKAAGRGPDDDPVTFGDLWGDGAAAAETAERRIDLVMVCSDVSRHRSAQLPFLETPSRLYVEKAVLRRLLPPRIARWMIDEKPGDRHAKDEAGEDVVRLPAPAHLPIVFAARMSLSFPLLLSAVRLRTPDFTRKRVATGRYELRRVWFSDGGLTSNFPIHFFDSPLPSRPTFCLNLVDFDTGIDVARQPPDNDVEGAEEFDRAELADKPIAAAADPRRKAQARPKAEALRSGATEYNVWDYVSLPRDNRIRAIPFTDFERTGGVGGFLAALVNTARFWSDNQLLISPGVRERVVDIALRDDEGGLNIDMHPDVVAELDGRGQAAGKLIAARFDPAAATDPETGEAIRRAFPNHRWVRYRNLMSAFEDFGRRFVLARRRSDAAAARRGELSIAAMIDGQTRADAPIGYPAPAAARNFFKSQTRAVTEMLLAMAEATRKDATQTFDADERNGAAPRPKIRLRLRPLVNNDPRVESVAPPAREDAAAAPRPSA